MPLYLSMTCLGNTKEVEVSSSKNYDKWRKVVVLLRECKKISNMSLNIYTRV